MRSKIILAGLIATLTAVPAYAESSSREESLGIGFGATIGGIAGGPVGMVLGAAIGARIGGEMHQRDTAVEQLSASLQGSQHRVNELERDIDALGGDLQRMQDESRPPPYRGLTCQAEFPSRQHRGHPDPEWPRCQSRQ